MDDINLDWKSKAFEGHLMTLLKPLTCVHTGNLLLNTFKSNTEGFKNKDKYQYKNVYQGCN